MSIKKKKKNMCFGIRKKKAFRIYQSQSQLCVGRRGVLTDRQTDIFLLLLLLLIRRIRLHKHNHDRNIIIIFGYTLSRFLKEDLCLKERKGDLLWLPPLNLASSANISPFTTSFHPFLQCVCVCVIDLISYQNMWSAGKQDCSWLIDTCA